MILLLSLLLSTAQARFSPDQVFSRSSPLPRELQERILIAIEGRCPHLNPGAHQLFEERTEVEERRIDQGVTDYLYYTEIGISRLLEPEPDEPDPSAIFVSSSKSAINNPSIDPLHIHRLSGCR